MLKRTSAVMGLFGALALLPATAGAVPNTMNQEGLVLDQGQPVAGETRLTFSMWDAAEAGNRLWTETHDLELVDGYYQVALGRFNALAGVFDGSDRYLGISVDGAAELSPRQPVGSVAYSLQAGAAETAGNADLLEGVDSSKFMRVDRDAGTAGNLLVGGSMIVHQLLSVGGGLENYDTINIVAAPARFPSGDDTANEIAEGGARLGVPMVYRTSRTPADGSADAPFDRSGELVLQGTSHGAGHNRGISLVTAPEGGDPAVRLRVTPEGRIGVGGTAEPRAALHVGGVNGERAPSPALGVYVGAPNSGVHIYSGTADDMSSIILQSHHSPDPGVRLRTDAQDGGLIVEGYNDGAGDVEVAGVLRAAAVEVGGVTVINEQGRVVGAGGGGGSVPPGALVLAPSDCDDCQDNLEDAGFVQSEFTFRGSGPTTYDFDGASWGRRADIPSRKLWSSAAAAGGKFYAFGGHTSDNKTYEYTPENNSWRRMADMPSGRYAFTCDTLTHGDGREYIHCVGGQGGGYLNVNERFDPNANSWNTNFARLGTPAYCVQGATYENELYVFGGYDGNYYPWVQIYNPLTDTWRRGRDMPVGRAEHNVAVAGGMFYIVAGTGPGLSAPDSRVDRYDPEQNTWERMPDLPWRASQPGVAGIGPRLLVFGGTGASRGTSCNPCYRNTYEFNPDTNSWTRRQDAPDMGGRGRAFASVAAVGNTIFVTGGEPWHVQTTAYTVPGEGIGSVRFQGWTSPGLEAE